MHSEDPVQVWPNEPGYKAACPLNDLRKFGCPHAIWLQVRDQCCTLVVGQQQTTIQSSIRYISNQIITLLEQILSRCEERCHIWSANIG
jgi:hypothetical protein